MPKVHRIAKAHANFVNMSWILLIIAGLFETSFTFCLGKAEQYRKDTGSLSEFWLSLFLLCLCISMYLMYKCTQMLPLGVVYPVWTGIGALGAVMLGIFYFHEPISFWKIFFILSLVGSVIGIKAVS